MRIRRYVATDATALRQLLARRTVADGRSPLSEHKALHAGDVGVIRLVADAPGEGLVAYAVGAHHDAGAGHWAIETVVEPHRPDVAGLIGSLAEAVERQASPHQLVTIWGWRPEDFGAAAEHGWPEIRRLHQMTVTLPVAGEPTPPPGVRMERFRRGIDEEAWLEANAVAFARHPENGSVDRANLEARLAQPWFDAEGFLMAWRAEQLVGFCWTKLHPGSVGEIYIIGVVPAAQGQGLGVSLLHAGLNDLAGRQGAVQGMLYVGADDTRAMQLYRQLGFEVVFSLREFAVYAPETSAG